MASGTTQKLSLFALTTMVVGGMVGAGIFSLPRTFAGATGPIGAIIAKESVMTWPRASHGSTYAGNPVCCEAALATLDIVEPIMGQVAQVGETLMNGLAAGPFPAIQLPQFIS